MREIYEFAEFLSSAWRLANQEERIPTSHGVLDQVLYEMRDKLPAKFRDVLTFGNTRVGFRCYELPDILYAAAVQIDDAVFARELAERAKRITSQDAPAA